MASTSSISKLELSPNKRRKLDNIDNTSWKDSTKQQIYTTKLVQALNNIPPNNNNAPKKSTLGRVVRRTADRVLAVTAKGRTRWSRAILTSRLSSRLCQISALHKRANNKQRKSKCQTIITRHYYSKSRKSTEEIELDKKVKMLGSLIPGCRKVSFPDLLEESRDYIEALQMQVRAMSVLTQLLSGGDTSSSSSPPVQSS